MSSPLVAVVFAIFVWWFSTGLVLLLNRLSLKGVRTSQVLSTAVAALALVGLSHTAGQTGLSGAYCAFTCALLLWGWQELSFLSGWVTGPRRSALPAGLTGWPRFVQSVRALLWHELAIVAGGAAVVALTWGQPNQVGTGTYAVLWAMRTSAKLNLYFGVRNLSEAFLPPHLAYLPSFFRRRRMNAFLPLALAAALAVLTALVLHAVQPGAQDATRVGAALVATLLAMAIVEHLMLVLPLDTTALWRWALRSAPSPRPGQP